MSQQYLLHETDLSAILTFAITTVLVIRVFRLSLRAARDFIDSFFSDERSATLCRIAAVIQQAGKIRLMSVSNAYRGVKSRSGDSARRLKVFSGRRVKVKKHGGERRRIWRKRSRR